MGDNISKFLNLRNRLIAVRKFYKAFQVIDDTCNLLRLVTR
jgi:hypothetical protein